MWVISKLLLAPLNLLLDSYNFSVMCDISTVFWFNMDVHLASLKVLYANWLLLILGPPLLSAALADCGKYDRLMIR